jgi:hypothetical protein
MYLPVVILQSFSGYGIISLLADEFEPVLSEVASWCVVIVVTVVVVVEVRGFSLLHFTCIDGDAPPAKKRYKITYIRMNHARLLLEIIYFKSILKFDYSRNSNY